MFQKTLVNGIFTLAEPEFISNSQFVTGHEDVRIYSTGGVLAKTLPINHVRCLKVQRNILYVASNDEVQVWDYLAGVHLKSYNANEKVVSILPMNDCILVATALGSIVSFSKDSEKRKLVQKNDKKLIGMGPMYDGNIVAAWSDSYAILNPVKGQIKSYKGRITAMAVHPTESILAIGDYSGKITLLFIDSHKSEKLPVSSQFHWHSHKVNCITFSADGNYLLSGGEEAVLVLWQFQTGSRQFLPRLGAEISSIRISQNQGLYLISLKDNGVKIVNSSNLSIVKDIHGLTAAYFDRNNYPMSVGILADPINDTIMLNGVPGSLQFYDIESQRSKYQVDVSPRNRISRRDKQEIIHSHVQYAKLSTDGSWLITVNVRQNGEFENECYLKFWAYDVDTQRYALNSRVNKPHSLPLTSISICKPRQGYSLRACTTSEDGSFKVWELQDKQKDTSGALSNIEHWTCVFQGAYKGLPCGTSDFSDDGSVLAVSFGPVITLWDAYELRLCESICRSSSSDKIEHVAFLNQCPNLVAASTTHLYYWDMLSCTVKWAARLTVKHIATDPASSKFAILRKGESTDVLDVFSAHQSTPVNTFRLQTDAFGLCFLKKNNVVVLDSRYNLNSWQLDKTRTSANVTSLDNANLEDTSKFILMYGDLSQKEANDSKKAILQQDTISLKMFNFPSHVMPQPSKMFNIYIREIAKPRIESPESLDDSPNDSHDVSMEEGAPDETHVSLDSLSAMIQSMFKESKEVVPR